MSHLGRSTVAVAGGVCPLPFAVFSNCQLDLLVPNHRKELRGELSYLHVAQPFD